MKTVIELQNVSFSYDLRPILENLNLEIKVRDFTAIIGPNGGGKTTLLRLILGSLQPDRGNISVFGVSPKKARFQIGYVPQHAFFDQGFPITALEVVLMGTIQANSLFFRYSLRDHLAAMQAMDALNIADLADVRYGQLSGGEKQRVLIARALVGKPKLLILDEPTASVDSRVEHDVYELLKELNGEIPILIVSHDLGFVSSYVNKVVCLNKQLEVHDVDDISKGVITNLYKSPMEMINHQCLL